MNHSLEEILKQFPKDVIFKYEFPFNKYYIIAYPYLKAYIYCKSTDIYFEVIPEIKIKESEIILPKDDFEDPEDGFDSIIDLNRGQLEERFEKITEPAFFSRIPTELQDIVSPYGESQWELLKAILKFGEEFKSLVAASTTTAFLILHIDRLNPTFSCYINMTYLLGLAKRKQKELIKLALFPKTNQMVKILNNIDPQALSIKSIIGFRNSLQFNHSLTQKVLKHLSHRKKKIDKSLMAILANHFYVFEKMSFKEVEKYINSPDLKVKVLRTRESVKKNDKWEKHFLRLEEKRELKEREARIQEILKEVERLEKIYQEQRKIFPEPPLGGSEFIRPIKNLDELEEWSIRQKNCARGEDYIQRIKSKDCYIYSVNYNGEEATLEIIIRADGYKIGQLKGEKNITVSVELRKEVKSWFRKELLNNVKEKIAE